MKKSTVVPARWLENKVNTTFEILEKNLNFVKLVKLVVSNLLSNLKSVVPSFGCYT